MRLFDVMFVWEFLERAEGIEPSSSVWKTEVLTITQRPRPLRDISQALARVKTLAHTKPDVFKTSAIQQG